MQLFYPLELPSDNIGIHKHHDTTKNQSYIPITGCVLSHILSSKELSSLEKIYYILADSLSCINSSKGRNRSISLPAKSWAEKLSCSKSEVYLLQKSLEDKEYFIIYRDKNDKGQNNRNTITTTIPDNIFNDLKYEPDRFDLCDVNNTQFNNSHSERLYSIKDKTFIPTLEVKRQHLEKTKMFIRISYQFLKELNSNYSISATSKILILYFLTKIYKSSFNKYDYNNSVDVLTHHSYSIVTSYQELQKEFKLHRNSIAKAFKDLEANNLISKQRFFIKDTEDYNSRADKSLWKISLLKAFLINNNDQKEQRDQKQPSITNDQDKNIETNKTLKYYKELECTKYDPPCTNFGQFYNKGFLLKNKSSKDIDYIDAHSKNLFGISLAIKLFDKSCIEENYKEKELENEQSSFSSESYHNSFKNVIDAKPSCSNTTSESAASTIEDISEYKELRYFYPLSEKDIDTLNFRSCREFSNNFMNQLLLKLYIKYPEKRFKNKFTFLSYMAKTLKNEKHQGPLVNHTTFRFSCNIGTEETKLLEYEKYLTQIENSFDTNKEMQVKKKIAGRFSTEVAYAILTQIEFKTNHNNSFITALVPNRLNLSERQIATLSEQLEAVYGVNGYYVTAVEDEDVNTENVGNSAMGRWKGEGEEVIEKQYSKIKEPDIISNSKDIGILDIDKEFDKIEGNTLWHQIRKGLIEELGEAIDEVWFSKVVAAQCNDTKTLTLTMPTRFMADWIRNNYSHVIRRFARSVGIDIVKYHYE